MGNVGAWKLVGCCALTGLATFALAFLILNQWYCNSVKDQVQSMLGSENFSEEGQLDDKVYEDFLSDEMQRAVDQQRARIRKNMKDYEYPEGKYNISAEKLEDFLLEENGKPVRSIILTTWRSGSTFLGDIIDQHSPNFYHYEPLVDFDVVQVRGPPLNSTALRRVKNLFNCEYDAAHVHYVSTHVRHNYFTSNFQDDFCSTNELWCKNKKYLEAMCKLYPFQSMKLTRLRLNIARELLADDNLAVRMVLLVRDPRATFKSRKSCEWCTPSRDCIDPALLCADLAADYRDAVVLSKKYPNTFRVIRYEDLSAEPYERAEELANFFGIGFQQKMINFLDTHTVQSSGDSYSTLRDTKGTPYRWKTELQFEEVEEIQRSCAAAMEYWGYVPAINSTHQREFNPLTSYILD